MPPGSRIFCSRMIVLFFSKASPRGAKRLQEILNIYSRSSGQMVNRYKPASFFSANCTDIMKTEVKETLHVETEALRRSILAFLRLCGLVGTWSGREASCSGREALLKTVAQAIPTYPTSCFLIPKNTF